MKHDTRTPCASCPYRKDSPLKLWHKSEFQNLLRQDANEYGGNTFACHEHRKKPPEEHRRCIGWLLDQRSRGYPSIQLRLQLMRNPVAAVQADEAHDGGAQMYPSIKAMCRANGVRA